MDEPAFWQWAQTYRPYLKGLAAKILGSKGARYVDASDIVQTAFQVALDRFEQFRGQTLPEWQAFLAAIVRFKALNAVGRPSPEVAPGGSAGDLAQVPADGSSPSSQILRRELAGRALEALNRLEQPYRDALWLWFFEDLDHAEIALRLDITPAASRKLRERALQKLRELWGDQS